MTRQPDRFERMVNNGAVTPGGHSIYITDAIALLRREHRAMVRVVKKELMLLKQKLAAQSETRPYSHMLVARTWLNIAEGNVIAALQRRAR